MARLKGIYSNFSEDVETLLKQLKTSIKKEVCARNMELVLQDKPLSATSQQDILYNICVPTNNLINLRLGVIPSEEELERIKRGFTEGSLADCIYGCSDYYYSKFPPNTVYDRTWDIKVCTLDETSPRKAFVDFAEYLIKRQREFNRQPFSRRFNDYLEKLGYELSINYKGSTRVIWNTRKMRDVLNSTDGYACADIVQGFSINNKYLNESRIIEVLGKHGAPRNILKHHIVRYAFVYKQGETPKGVYKFLEAIGLPKGKEFYESLEPRVRKSIFLPEVSLEDKYIIYPSTSKTYSHIIYNITKDCLPSSTEEYNKVWAISNIASTLAL